MTQSVTARGGASESAARRAVPARRSYAARMVVMYAAAGGLVCAWTYMMSLRTLARLGAPRPGLMAACLTGVLAGVALLSGAIAAAVTVNAPDRSLRRGIAYDAMALVATQFCLATAYHVLNLARPDAGRWVALALLAVAAPLAAAGLCARLRFRRGWKWPGAGPSQMLLALFFAMAASAWAFAVAPFSTRLGTFIGVMVLLNLLYLTAYSLRIVTFFRKEFDAQCTRR